MRGYMKSLDYNDKLLPLDLKPKTVVTPLMKKAVDIADRFGGYALIGKTHAIVDLSKFYVSEK